MSGKLTLPAYFMQVHVSALHMDVSRVLNSMGMLHTLEHVTDDQLFSIDIAFPGIYFAWVPALRVIRQARYGPDPMSQMANHKVAFLVRSVYMCASSLACPAYAMELLRWG